MAKLCAVNTSLLPVKLHYFLFFGAMGGVFPYMPLLAKSLGINATAVGLVYTVMSFCVLFSKPIFGYLTDYFQNIKIIVFILVIVTAVSYLLVLLIPSVDNNVDKPISVHLTCINDDAISLYPLQYNKLCMEKAMKQKVHFDLLYESCGDNVTLTVSGKMHELKFESSEIVDESDSKCVSNVGLTHFYAEIKLEGNFTCRCIENNSSFVTNYPSYIKPCFCETEIENSLVYNTYQFWVFALLTVISSTGSATVCCLSDSACYEVLGENPELFGRQRLWATISWGAITALSGFLNDLASGSSDQKDYSPGFYLMLALVIVDLALLLKIRLTKANFSMSICKDIGKIFSSCETIVFAIAVYIIGGLTGLLWNYEFWFLQDIGADQTLLGLAVAVQSLAAEVPFFFFSGWFVKTFGHFFCLTFTLTAFALRFAFYFFLENPWFVLPIELLHGLTFCIFHTSMTAYASTSAPPGTEATMMGILGGIFEGLGVATGSLLGGVGFDKLGGRHTFLVASVISLISAPLFLLSYFFARKASCRKMCKIKIVSKKELAALSTEHET